MKKFTMFFMAIFAALSLQAAELNIYACGLNATVSDNVATVEYVLNAPATGLELQLYAAGADPILVPITAAEALTKGAHSVEVDLSAVKAGTYTWGLKASAAAIETSSVVSVSDTVLTTPRGLAVDADPESPFFGTIYVADPVSKFVSGGLYMYNALGKRDTMMLNGAFNLAAASPMHLYVAEDHQVIVSDWSDVNPNIVVFDPAQPTMVKRVFANNHCNSDGVDTTATGEQIHGSMAGAATIGVGANRVLYTIDEDVNVNGNLAIFRYNIGEMSSLWDKVPSDTFFTNTDKLLQNSNNIICPDKNGGLWVSQYRWTDAKGIPSLIHITAAGAVDYNSAGALKVGANTANRGAFALSPDQTEIAVIVDTELRLYTIEYPKADSIALSLKSTATGVCVQTACYQVAFDYAGNVYVIENGKALKAVSFANANNSKVTPAATAKTIVVEGPKTLASVLADKTIRRALNDQEHVYVLAIDADKNPTLVKADLEGNVVTEYATDFCSVTADGVMKLSDIAMTEDGVLIGCNQEKCVFDYSGNTNPFQVYKWAADGTGEVALTYSYAYLVSMTWSNGYTGVTMAFKGTLADGQMLVAGKSASGTAKDKMKQLLLEIKADTIYSASVNTNEKKIIAGLQNLNYPADLQFITLGSEKVPQLFTYVNTGGIDKYETIHSSLANAYSGTQGASVAKKGDAVWMMIPSIDGVEILDITAGLASAPQVHELAAASSVEASFMYAGLVEDGKKVVLMRGANLEVISLPKYLNDVLADKTIRRVVNDQEHVYVLAVDADKNPTLVKADFDGKIVTEYATDFCSKVGTVGLEMVLSDIALTEDGVLIGCNLENCRYDAPVATNPFNIYGWNEDGTGKVVFTYTKPFWASACWTNGLTGVTMAYKGTLANGQMLVAGRHGNNLASQRHKQVLMAIKDSAVLQATVNEGQSYTEIALPDLQNVNHPDSAKFITLASNKVPQLFEYINTGVAAAKTETLKGALAATYSGAKGVSVAKKDAAVWMMIPSISGVEILNITAGLASAPQEHNLAAASSLEADFLYAGLVEDGEKVVLMRGTSLELIDIPGTGTELKEIEAAEAEVKKVIVNGHIFIIREGHMYDMNGMQVK